MEPDKLHNKINAQQDRCTTRYIHNKIDAPQVAQQDKCTTRYMHNKIDAQQERCTTRPKVDIYFETGKEVIHNNKSKANVAPIHTVTANRSGFLISVLDGEQWTASRSGRFKPGGKSPMYPMNTRLVGTHSQSERFGQETISCFCRERPQPGHYTN
jgi:hypothetical protein